MIEDVPPRVRVRDMMIEDVLPGSGSGTLIEDVPPRVRVRVIDRRCPSQGQGQGQ